LTHRFVRSYDGYVLDNSSILRTPGPPPRLDVRFGLVHYATFPESLTGLGAFQQALETSTRGDAWDVIELSTQLPRAWTTRARNLGLPAAASLFLSAGPEMLAWRDALNAESRRPRARAVDRARGLVDLAVEAGAENLMLTSGPIAGSLAEVILRLRAVPPRSLPA
jgi:hypothetical protein